MSKAITTGPFMAPRLVNPIFNPSLLTISLKNPTDKEKKVRVIVEECPQVNPLFFPTPDCVVSEEVPENIICNEKVTLSSHHCRFVFVHFSPFANTTLRVTVKGDVDDDAEGIEVGVVGSDEGRNFNEPTMFFRHEDFVEVDDD